MARAAALPRGIARAAPNPPPGDPRPGPGEVDPLAFGPGAGPDLLLRHALAQRSKAFFGYGPKGRAFTVLQGPVAVFGSELTSDPDLVAALRAEPFGRLCMRHINGLFVARQQEDLRRLAAGAGVRLAAVGSDLDFAAGWSLGVAVADAPLPGSAPDGPAEPAVAAALADALGVQHVTAGPALVWALLPGTAPPEPSGAEGAGAAEALAAWAERSAEVGRDLRRALGVSAGRTPRATFLVPAPGGAGCLAGAVLPA